MARSARWILLVKKNSRSANSKRQPNHQKPKQPCTQNTMRQDRASLINFGNVELLTLCDGHGEAGTAGRPFNLKRWLPCESCELPKRCQVGHDVAEVCCEASLKSMEHFKHSKIFQAFERFSKYPNEFSMLKQSCGALGKFQG